MNEETISNSNNYFFSKHYIIWGWATWKDAWSKYDVEMKSYKHSEFAETFKNIVEIYRRSS